MKYCPKCGEELIDDAKFCKSCGASITGTPGPTQPSGGPLLEKSYKAHYIIGYILAILFPILGIIMGIYLITRKDSEDAKKHGKYVIIVAVIVWALSFLSMMFY